MATSVAVWLKRGAFEAHVTLDLRVDYLRPAVPERTVIGRTKPRTSSARRGRHSARS